MRRATKRNRLGAVLVFVGVLAGCGALSALARACPERVRTQEGVTSVEAEAARRDSIQARTRAPQGETVPRTSSGQDGRQENPNR